MSARDSPPRPENPGVLPEIDHHITAIILNDARSPLDHQFGS